MSVAKRCLVKLSRVSGKIKSDGWQDAAAGHKQPIQGTITKYDQPGQCNQQDGDTGKVGNDEPDGTCLKDLVQTVEPVPGLVWTFFNGCHLSFFRVNDESGLSVGTVQKFYGFGIADPDNRGVIGSSDLIFIQIDKLTHECDVGRLHPGNRMLFVDKVAESFPVVQ